MPLTDTQVKMSAAGPARPSPSVMIPRFDSMSQLLSSPWPWVRLAHDESNKERVLEIFQRQHYYCRLRRSVHDLQDDRGGCDSPWKPDLGPLKSILDEWEFTLLSMINSENGHM